MHLYFFSIKVFFHRQWRFTEQQKKGGNHLLFHSTTSARSRTDNYLQFCMHVRWLSRIFNRNACIYQTATGWDLPPYWVIIELLNYHLLDWLIDDAVLVCLLDDLILGFCYNYLNTGNQWIWTRNDYHLCITIEPTNQVCYSSTLTSNINISGTLFHWYI